MARARHRSTRWIAADSVAGPAPTNRIPFSSCSRSTAAIACYSSPEPMAPSNLVLITGVGEVGRTALELLRAQDVPVRAMVRRDDDRAVPLRALGAEVVVGDLTR